jgi:transcription initiation factor TFIID subunit 7
LENVNPDLSDSEFIERDELMDAPTPGVIGSEAGDAPTPGPDFGGDEGEAEEAEEDEGEGDIDEDLAAELDLALGDEDEEGEGDDEDDEEEDESEDDDEDDDDDDEEAQERKLLNEEIRDLEAAVLKKQTEIASSANPLIKVFFYTVFTFLFSYYF